MKEPFINDGDKDKVIEAVKELSFCATAPAVSQKTGLALNECCYLLNSIAAESLAKLEVTGAGGLIYSFDRGFENACRAKGIEKALNDFANVTFRTAFFALRVSFGIVLIASIVIVLLLIVTALIAGLFSDSGGGGGGGGGDSGGSFDFFDVSSIGDGFSWNYSSPHQRRIERYGVPEGSSLRIKKNVEKGNFLLECFSFLFGDGEPNAGIDEKSWKMIAHAINVNHGVVAIEQLIPLSADNSSADEFGFAVMARFNGRPEVSDKGNILLIFDDFRNATPSKIEAESATYLQEKFWRFSVYPATSLIFVLVFAGLNFMGSYWLFNHMATIASLQHFRALIDFLLGYGSLFLAIPFLRILFNQIMNLSIRERNNLRRNASRAVHNPSPELSAKLLDAQAMKQLPQLGANKEVIYTSDKDLLEQQIEKLN